MRCREWRTMQQGATRIVIVNGARCASGASLSMWRVRNHCNSRRFLIEGNSSRNRLECKRYASGRHDIWVMKYGRRTGWRRHVGHGLQRRVANWKCRC